MTASNSERGGQPGRSAAVDEDLELLTAEEVASLLRVARSTVYELSRVGGLRSVVISRGLARSCRRWTKSDVRKYIENCRTVQGAATAIMRPPRSRSAGRRRP